MIIVGNVPMLAREFLHYSKEEMIKYRNKNEDADDFQKLLDENIDKLKKEERNEIPILHKQQTD